MNSFLQNEREKKYIGVSQLTDAAAGVLGENSADQTKGSVTEYPDERTVRYYLSEGLIPPPEEKKGTSSVFSYWHLLALLAVKTLQREHLPIKKIKSLLGGKTVEELEQLIGAGNPIAATGKSKNEAQNFLETLLLERKPVSEEEKTNLLFSDAAPPAAGITRSPAPPVQKAQTWQRFEIAEGLELHIENNFNSLSGSRDRRLLIKVIEQVIERFEQKQ